MAGHINQNPDVQMTLQQYARSILIDKAARGETITYQAFAKALKLLPPHTIHRATVVLEQLIEEDSRNGHPLIATLVISKARNGLPASGFFDCAIKFRAFRSTLEKPNNTLFYNTEFDLAVDFWAPKQP
jgi:hypothetical protein